MGYSSLTREVLSRCDIVAGFSEELGRITRTFLRPAMRDVHVLLSAWMREAGLRVHDDALGNLIGRRRGKADDSPTFIVGSHIDTVPNGGRYDGVLGVLLGIAAIKALGDEPLHQTIDIIAFSEEEGVRYGTPYFGSAAVAGNFDPAWLKLKDADGIALPQALINYGLDPDLIPQAAYPKDKVNGYLEVHIEQGPVLESRKLPIGIVEAIVGQSRRWLTFTGKAGHAGTQPMELRRDALSGVAEFITWVEKLARMGDGLRATVGSLVVEPGVVNVVPGKVRLSLDIRHATDTMRRSKLNELLQRAAKIANERGLQLDVETILDQSAVPADPELMERLAQACKDSSHDDFRLVSGAGHDAVMMAGLCPMAMLFIRSIGGISHHPEENVHADDVRIALEVLVRFLEQQVIT